MSSQDFPLTLQLDPDARAVETWRKAAKGLVKPSQIDKALAMAINRALASMRTEANKQARAQYVVKRDDIINAMKATNASVSKLSAELVFTGGRMPLLQFKVSPPTPNPYKGKRPKERPGLKVQIRKDGGGKAPHLFVQDLGHGAAVYKRESKGKYHLAKETGPSVVSMVGNETAKVAIQARAQQVLSERIDHEMRRLLQK